VQHNITQEHNATKICGKCIGLGMYICTVLLVSLNVRSNT